LRALVRRLLIVARHFSPDAYTNMGGRMRVTMNTLSTAVEELNWVLSAGTSCSTRAWVERLDSALESIGQAIGLHGDPLEPLERVDPSVGGQVPSPTTDRQVGRLHSELTGLLHDLSDLRARLLLALEACLEDDPAPGDH